MKMAIDNRLRASANAKNDYQQTCATTASRTRDLRNLDSLKLPLHSPSFVMLMSARSPSQNTVSGGANLGALTARIGFGAH